MIDKISSIGVARAKKLDDNREWNLRDMCEYIIQEIDNGDDGLKNSTRAILIYETEQNEDHISSVWHVAMKASFKDRLELIEWHKFFLFKEWEA